MIKLKCKKCKKQFLTYPCRLSGNYGHKALYCSKSCANSITQNGKETRFKKGQISFFTLHPERCIRGINHHFWKGDKVGYRALHYWLNRIMGKPIRCDHCGKPRTTPKSMQWANISGKYHRDPNDYISLCPSCHKKFDLKK